MKVCICSYAERGCADVPQDEVSWRTAYLNLLPFALCVMAQPSGRVLSLHPRLGPYLRFSPIICGVDTLIILPRISACKICGASLRDSFRNAYTARFPEETNETRRSWKITLVAFVALALQSSHCHNFLNHRYIPHVILITGTFINFWHY